jgi:hypothetical protein
MIRRSVFQCLTCRIETSAKTRQHKPVFLSASPKHATDTSYDDQGHQRPRSRTPNSPSGWRKPRKSETTDYSTETRTTPDRVMPRARAALTDTSIIRQHSRRSSSLRRNGSFSNLGAGPERCPLYPCTLRTQPEHRAMSQKCPGTEVMSARSSPTRHVGFSKRSARFSSSSRRHMAAILIRSLFSASVFGLTGESKCNLINVLE